ncbi:MAG TPA: hypothetical protein VMR59_01755 [Patescibacteria group bacterium]|jgi:hypothetical protein|nr:hypothetical protein [Patescibacteria group bacterium]
MPSTQEIIRSVADTKEFVVKDTQRDEKNSEPLPGTCHVPGCALPCRVPPAPRPCGATE